jgi:hypothetical protein
MGSSWQDQCCDDFGDDVFWEEISFPSFEQVDTTIGLNEFKKSELTSKNISESNEITTNQNITVEDERVLRPLDHLVSGTNLDGDSMRSNKPEVHFVSDTNSNLTGNTSPPKEKDNSMDDYDLCSVSEFLADLSPSSIMTPISQSAVCNSKDVEINHEEKNSMRKSIDSAIITKKKIDEETEIVDTIVSRGHRKRANGETTSKSLTGYHETLGGEKSVKKLKLQNQNVRTSTLPQSSSIIEIFPNGTHTDSGYGIINSTNNQEKNNFKEKSIVGYFDFE